MQRVVGSMNGIFLLMVSRTCTIITLSAEQCLNSHLTPLSSGISHNPGSPLAKTQRQLCSEQQPWPKPFMRTSYILPNSFLSFLSLWQELIETFCLVIYPLLTLLRSFTKYHLPVWPPLIILNNHYLNCILPHSLFSSFHFFPPLIFYHPTAIYLTYVFAYFLSPSLGHKVC